MKAKVIHSVFLAAAIGALSGGTMAADYKQNPFTLAYEGAITENVKGKVNIRTVTYKLNGLDISANVYTPANYDSKQEISDRRGRAPERRRERTSGRLVCPAFG